MPNSLLERVYSSVQRVCLLRQILFSDFTDTCRLKHDLVNTNIKRYNDLSRSGGNSVFVGYCFQLSPTFAVNVLEHFHGRCDQHCVVSCMP
jgi:hypothetical protein